MHLTIPVCLLDLGLINKRQDGRTGFCCACTPSVGAGGVSAPCRLSDRLFRPQFCTACRSFPAWKILSFSLTNGSSLRQRADGELLHLLHGDLSGQQPGLSPRSPDSPLPAALLALLALLPRRTPLQRLADLVPPLARRPRVSTILRESGPHLPSHEPLGSPCQQWRSLRATSFL